MKREYRVVVSEHPYGGSTAPANLEREVTALMKLGWNPLPGGFQVCGGTCFYQAMTREEM